MSGREPPRRSDPDDWFADSRRAAPPSRSGTTAVETWGVVHEESGVTEDWLDDERAGAQSRGLMAATNISLRTALAAAVVALVLIVAGLAVGGVFSGGKQHVTSPPTAPGSTTRQTPTTTPAPPTRSTPAAPTNTLKPGDQGSQVKLLQRALTRLGYPVRAADGVYGPATQAALTRFQKASGLAADGVLGPKTLQALKQALQRSG